MPLPQKLRRRMDAIFHRDQLDARMDDEMRLHLEMQTQENIEAGMSPETARREASRLFGWVGSVKERCRDERGVRWLENLAQDVRYGARMLWKNPAFTAVAVTTIALGVGANTAVFSLVNALLVRPLPFRDPTRLVWIANPDASAAGVPGLTRSVNLRDWRELNHSFERLGCYVPVFERQETILTVNGDPIRVQGLWIDDDFLRVLGVSPRLGRDFTHEEGQDEVILTDTFWKRRFQSDPAILGKTITLSGKPWAVAGVLPPEFDFSSVFTPGSKVVDFLRPSPVFGDMSDNSHAVIGRLKPGASIERAQIEFDDLNRRLRSGHPERGGFGARLTPLREHVAGQFRRPFLLLAGAVGSVLLIACVNLSNLLLARAAARRKEIAVRMALGAGRGRLFRQMLTESLLLAAGGAALGLPLACLAAGATAQSRAFSVPLLSSARVDGAALLFTLLVTVLTGLLFGIAPALLLSKGDPQVELKEASRGATNGMARQWMGQLLVVSEVALACLLLVGAGLLTRSLVRLAGVDLGFRPGQVAACRIRVSRDFPTGLQAFDYYEDLARKIEALPGVESAGFTSILPFGPRETVKVRAKGETPPPDGSLSVFIENGSEGYFKTLRIPVVAGRNFDSRDTVFDFTSSPKAPVGVLVNETMARALWPRQDAVGRIIVFVMNDPSQNFECEVIGVAGNVRQSPLELEAAPQMYFKGAGRELVVRTREPLSFLAGALRAELRRVGSDLVLEDFKPLSQRLDQVVSPKRLVALLLGLFALLALFLASVGIYGVISWSVSQRTQEIGVRLALGSPAAAVLRLVIFDGMKLALAGCAIGLAASLALTRMMQALLFGVSPTDPPTLAGSGALLLSVAFLACWLPARRAARVDPMVALRCE